VDDVGVQPQLVLRMAVSFRVRAVVAGVRGVQPQLVLRMAVSFLENVPAPRMAHGAGVPKESCLKRHNLRRSIG
jgi:hypothetical protein